jgi:hypothetical protein
MKILESEGRFVIREIWYRHIGVLIDGKHPAVVVTAMGLRNNEDDEG